MSCVRTSAAEIAACKCHLLHIVQVLHAWRLPQVDAMGDVLTQHEGTDQVICVSCLAYSTEASLHKHQTLCLAAFGFANTMQITCFAVHEIKGRLFGVFTGCMADMWLHRNRAAQEQYCAKSTLMVS